MRNMKNIKIISIFIAIKILIITFVISTPFSAYCTDPRIYMGIDLFPSFLASDKKIKNKMGENNQLNILLLYNKNREQAEELAKRLLKVKKIRKIPVNVIIEHHTLIDKWQKKQLAGVFITETFLNISSIIKFGIDKKIIVFSPFEGDVEKGMATGFFISEKVVPFINKKTIQSSNIHFKSFFLRISKSYD
ncbi:hypothetical protein MHK_008740 [Candidatus Magnetomorum sp. HK-1]|nr:hypothetical protein MHK_008740 [Candidatus Magnetomorum sp. HK-1]